MRIRLSSMFLLLTSLMIVEYTSSLACPTGCTFCSIGSLSCRYTGLKQFPVTSIPTKITEIYFIGQRSLTDVVLKKNIFDHYGYPKYSVDKIVIQYSGIEGMETRTFSDMTKLTSITLTNNSIREIPDDAFAGLKLNELWLNKNKGIRFTANSFRGLQLTRLNINDCQIKKLAYATLMPLSNTLEQLEFSSNEISTLSSEFRPLFSRLVTMELKNNPFKCDCKLRWLVQVLRNYVKTSTSEPYVFAKCHDNENSEFYQKPIHMVNTKLLICEPPSLSSLELDMKSAEKATFLCLPKNEADHNILYQRLNRETNKWQRVSSRQFLLNGNQTSVMLSRTEEREIYSCRIENKNGHITANLSITWPPIPPGRPHVNSGSRRRQESLSHRRNPLVSYDNKKKPVEGRSDIDVDSNVEPKDDPSSEKPKQKSMFEKERFSFMEMIYAVVGTFLITLLLFIAFYWCWVTLRRSDRPKKGPYSTYDPAMVMYSADTAVYDLPHPPNYAPPPPPPPCRDQFLDYKTQRTIRYH